MADIDELNPEEVNERNQRLLQDLRRMYPTVAEVARPLARVQQRLFYTSDAPLRTTSGVVNSLSRRIPISRGRGWRRHFGTLASGLVAALLVAALALVLNQAHQSRSGGSGNSSGQVGPFSTLRMMDGNSGWAVAGKAVLQTSDGGMHWKDVTPSRASLTPDSVMDAFTPSQAWIAIPQANYAATRIFRTTDRGQNWQSTTIPTGQSGTRVAQITFVNAQDGWILANRGGVTTAEVVSIYRTTDGGKTWVNIANAFAASTDGPAPGHLPFGGAKSGIHFLNSSTGWITGTVLAPGIAWLFVTHDGGSTWHQQKLPLPQGVPSGQLSLRPPTFFSATEGILPVSFSNTVSGATVSAVIYSTHDGGATWETTSPVPVAPSAVNFLDMQHGWVTDGTAIYVTRDGGQSWTKTVPGGSFNHVTQLDFVSSAEGWAVNGQGKGAQFLLKTQDGGQTWTPVTSTLS